MCFDTFDQCWAFLWECHCTVIVLCCCCHCHASIVMFLYCHCSCLCCSFMFMPLLQLLCGGCHCTVIISWMSLHCCMRAAVMVFVVAQEGVARVKHHMFDCSSKLEGGGSLLPLFLCIIGVVVVLMVCCISCHLPHLS